MDCDCTSEISNKDFNEMTDEEKTYLNKLFQFYHFIQVYYDISDWSTKIMGTFFVKKMFEPYLGFDEIDDMFTRHNGNVSLPDIALMYNLKDFRALSKAGNKLNTPVKYTELEPCDYMDIFCTPGDTQRYSSFQSCFDEMTNNYQSNEVTAFRQEDKMEKMIQSSPCQYLEKFHICSEYCAWHKSFFGNISKDEFIQTMNYASPQRKVYKESMPIEKKIAGTHPIF